MPVGRPSKVEHVRDSLLKQLAAARGLVKAVLILETVRASKTCPGLHSKHVRRVVELAFMGVIASWEEFLEQVFVRYMCGANSNTVGVPALTIGRCLVIAQAYKVLTGDPEFDPTKDYMTWSDPGFIVKRASVFFKDGEPFRTALERNTERFYDATILRNRIAHASTKSVQDFKKVARKLLASNRLNQGYRVGDLLLDKAVRGFGSSFRSKTFFEAFMAFFEDCTNRIVP